MSTVVFNMEDQNDAVNSSDDVKCEQLYPLLEDSKRNEKIDKSELMIPMENISSPTEINDSGSSFEKDKYFRDGKKRIDFILAYSDELDVDKVNKRRIFEENMQNEGFVLEYEDKKTSQDGKTYFVKVHAPWNVLARVAELIYLKMPIKEYDIQPSKGFLSKFPNPFMINETILPQEPDYFTADFNMDQLSNFLMTDKETFFTSGQRGLLTYELLMRVPTDEPDKFGIETLVNHGAYDAAFPLNDGPFKSEHSILAMGKALNDRHLLYDVWARPGSWYKFQPLDLIRKYYGEKVGIYFAWLGFYTTMLIPAAIVGLLTFLYGCITLSSDIRSQEICDKYGAGNFTMCPLCDRQCSYWKLFTSCSWAKLTYLFDNGLTVFFAFFMAIWATTFLEFWKRKQAQLQYEWDVADLEFEERLRPEFEAKVRRKKINPVTQKEEPFLPSYSVAIRKCSSVSVVIFMICCVLATVFGVIIYRVSVGAALYAASTGVIRSNAKLVTSITAAFINLTLITLLNQVYQRLAVFLTEMENPRTDTEYDHSFTFKMFVFQFCNFYSSIFYISFFKGRLQGRPGDYDYRFGGRAEECDPAGCLAELYIQLAIIMVGKQAMNNFSEILLPLIMNWYKKRQAEKQVTKENVYTLWEQDYSQVDFPKLGFYSEYLEMVIQYGFVTIFVAAFPLAPLFALLNNIIEIRLDAYKFVTQWKRPVAKRAQDTGIWFGCLQGISFIAVLTNAFIIGWTSDFVPRYAYKYAFSPDNSLHGYMNFSLSFFDTDDFQERSIPEESKIVAFGNVSECRYPDYRHPPWSSDKYEFTTIYWRIFAGRLVFVLLFEHLVLLVTWLVAYLIPDVSSHVKLLMMREVYLAKQARFDKISSVKNSHSDDIVETNVREKLE